MSIITRTLIAKFRDGHSLYEQGDDDQPVLVDDSGEVAKLNTDRPLTIQDGGIYAPIWDFNTTPVPAHQAAFLSKRYGMKLVIGDVAFVPEES